MAQTIVEKLREGLDAFSATERRVVDAFAAAIAAWQPPQAGLATPLAMLLFGMVNWLFTWMKPGGAISHAQIAPIVADLFAGGVPAVQSPNPP